MLMLVSILARAEARALRNYKKPTLYDHSFQSSPAPRRGRYKCQQRGDICNGGFQSSPAPRRGRYKKLMRLIDQFDCFNPRPRRGAGATNGNT